MKRARSLKIQMKMRMMSMYSIKAPITLSSIDTLMLLPPPIISFVSITSKIPKKETTSAQYNW